MDILNNVLFHFSVFLFPFFCQLSTQTTTIPLSYGHLKTGSVTNSLVGMESMKYEKVMESKYEVLGRCIEKLYGN